MSILLTLLAICVYQKKAVPLHSISYQRHVTQVIFQGVFLAPKRTLLIYII